MTIEPAYIFHYKILAQSTNTIFQNIIWLAVNITRPCNIEPCNIIQIRTGGECNMNFI